MPGLVRRQVDTVMNEADIGSPIPGASDRINAMRSRHEQLARSIAHFEAKVSKQMAQLEKRNTEDDVAGDAVVDEDFGRHTSRHLRSTKADLHSEEKDLKELEEKKRTLEERVSGMEKDLGGLLR